MRRLATIWLAVSMALFAGSVGAAETMAIAIFTKNSTNPAYQAFRVAADQIARAPPEFGSCTSSRAFSPS